MAMPAQPQPRPAPGSEPPHDVLAAEAFIVPAPDPALHHEPPHDVLAAEEFALPAVDPVLHHHGPVSLPADPAGREEPHDVLAAEEYAFPAPRRAAGDAEVGDGRAQRPGRRQIAAGIALGLVVALRRRRGGRGRLG